MDYDTIGKVVITENVISKIMKECGIENATVIFRGNDYFISILRMDKEGMDLEIKNIAKPIKKEDVIQMVLTIDGKRYFLTLQVSSLRLSDGRLIVETKIVGNRCLEVQSKLDEIYESLRFFDLRRFQRINMDEETMLIFNMIPRAKVMLPMKEYIAYIKNISSEGVSFLTTKNFMDETAQDFNLNINFLNPAENIVVGGKVLRKSVMNISGTEFVEVGMSLNDNIYLNKRIMDYFKKRGGMSASLTKVVG